MIKWKIILAPGMYSRAKLSLFAWGKALVAYALNVWAFAPKWLADEGYGLCVFNSLSDAIAYKVAMGTSDGNRVYKIYEAEVKDRISPLPPPMILFSLDVGKLSPRSFGSFPKGTEMYRKVKLLKEVNYEKSM